MVARLARRSAPRVAVVLIAVSALAPCRYGFLLDHSEKSPVSTEAGANTSNAIQAQRRDGGSVRTSGFVGMRASTSRGCVTGRLRVTTPRGRRERENQRPNAVRRWAVVVRSVRAPSRVAQK